MDKKNLLTIKEFSRITRVPPVSLRYYDSLGILKPAWVDPGTGYRYYSVFQREQVYAIQFCVESGIPLKRFAEYEDIRASWIQYHDLFADGLDVLKTRVKKLQAMVDQYESIRSSFEHSERVHASREPAAFTLPGSWHIVLPYDEEDYNDAWPRYFHQLLKILAETDLEGRNSGVLRIQKDDGWKQYFFVNVAGDPRKKVETNRLLYIPEGQWLCREGTSDDITDILEWSKGYLQPEEAEIIMATELVVGNYNFIDPPVEQRVLLKKH